MNGNHVLIGLAIALGMSAYFFARKKSTSAKVTEFTALREKIRSSLRAEAGEKELSEVDEFIDKNYSDSTREGRKEILDQLIFRFVVSKAVEVANPNAANLKRKYVVLMNDFQDGKVDEDSWIDYCRTFVQEILFPKLKKVITEGELGGVVEKESMSWMYNPNSDYAEALWIRLLNDLVVEDIDADISDFMEMRGDV